jgi:hypothetical protein
MGSPSFDKKMEGVEHGNDWQGALNSLYTKRIRRKGISAAMGLFHGFRA